MASPAAGAVNLDQNKYLCGLQTYTVSTHVGIYGNEKADRLTKAAARRAHLAAARSNEQREDQALEALADSIVAAIMNR